MIEHLDLAQILGSTCSIDKSKRRRLDAVSKDIVKAKKVIVVSGAGISCSSGIPDFRSENGLYSLVKKRYPDTFVAGKDLFSSGLFQNPATTSVFLTFIAELSLACQKAQPTRTHHFIQKLDKTGRLLRSYTQNVDGFERRMGMESGGRGKGLSKTMTRNVELHGDLGRVRCILCQTDYTAEEEYVEGYREGNMPDCPACEERCKERVNRGSRALAIGTLRPAIVLYDEPHPLGDSIGDLQTYDLKRSPDIMLIMGTSLKVHGLKQLVKSFAKRMHDGEGKKKGLVVFVNATKPGKEWDGIIDVHVQGETDRWVEKVEEEWRRVKPGDWEVQTRLDGAILGNAVEEAKGIKGRLPAKRKGKSAAGSRQASYPTFTAGQLPTPRPSLSPSRPALSSSQSSSAPPTPCPAPDTEDGLPSPPSSPLSPPPASPSKRRAQVQTPIDLSPTKKPRAPASERGLLFGTPREPLQLDEKEQDWEDEVFGGSPKKAGRAMIVKKGLPVKIRESTSRDKENSPIKPGITAITRSRAGTRKLAEVVIGERKRVLRMGR